MNDSRVYRNETKMLSIKDLINIGVYTALHFAVVFAIGMSGFIPVLLVAAIPLEAFLGSIPFMLYLTKVKKMGMVSISGVILALIVLATGRPIHAAILILVAFLIADGLWSISHFRSAGAAILTCGIADLWIMGMGLPMFFGFRDNYMETLRSGYGDAYVEYLLKITPDWLFWVLTVVVFVFGILGGMFGKKILKKHFEKAGLL